MNSAASSLMAVCFTFMAGLLVCMGGYWFVQAYLFPPGTLQVRGVLKQLPLAQRHPFDEVVPVG